MKRNPPVLTTNWGQKLYWNAEQSCYLTVTGRRPNWNEIESCDEPEVDPVPQPDPTSWSDPIDHPIAKRTTHAWIRPKERKR